MTWVVLLDFARYNGSDRELFHCFDKHLDTGETWFSDSLYEDLGDMGGRREIKRRPPDRLAPCD
jgi:hypothetical protein